MNCRLLIWLFVFALQAETVRVKQLHSPVEILRDRWGVPHIYAKNTHDLFFAQGYITAKDRLFQIDLWRRIGTGKLAEVLGAGAVPRDRIARLVRYRGDWNAEWNSYAPDAKEIAEAFTQGINAYIGSLGGNRTAEFAIAGYDPGLWTPEDVTARVAGLLMTGNAAREVARAIEYAKYGRKTMEKMFPPDPLVELRPPAGLELNTITRDILRDYTAAIGEVRFPGEQGSNNWVADGTMTKSGKPLLANDPHRPVQLPSLRKTVHLVAPGWNVIGAGEPALPGVALGHNETVAFGFTIVGIDQQDLYVEKLNAADPTQYRYKGGWKWMDVEKTTIAVKGEKPWAVELHYTVHGPVLYEDKEKHLAYTLRWVGSEAGGAGYLPALSLARSKDWSEFRANVDRYKVPSENLVYADTSGNIGWIAAGLAPVRKNWTGLFPVPGDNGEYEWDGYLATGEHPQSYNPAGHFIATSNNNILPPGYDKQLSYEWASPFRVHRVEQILNQKRKFDVADFEALQQDVMSLPARRFQEILRRWEPRPAEADRLLHWNCRLAADSEDAALFEFWMAKLPAALFGKDLAAGFIAFEVTFDELENGDHSKALASSLADALKDLPKGAKWGDIHKLTLRHALNRRQFDLPAVARGGDSNTVNATSGASFQQVNGASYRQVIDLADWDKSMMTNVPGESGDPASKHYSDLLADWAEGRYHPMPFSRTAVEEATEERILLKP